MRHFYIQAAGHGKLRCICVVWVMRSCNGLKKHDSISAMLSHTTVHRSDEETVRQHCLTPGTAVVTVIHNTILMSPKRTAISNAPCRVHKHTPSLLLSLSVDTDISSTAMVRKNALRFPSQSRYDNFATLLNLSGLIVL